MSIDPIIPLYTQTSSLAALYECMDYPEAKAEAAMDRIHEIEAAVIATRRPLRARSSR